MSGLVPTRGSQPRPASEGTESPDRNGGRLHVGDGMRLDELGISEAVRDVSAEWPSFRGRAQVTPFLQPEYLAAWARMRGTADACRCVIARRQGELVGWGAFMVQEEPFGPLSLPTLRFIGNNIGFPG